MKWSDIDLYLFYLIAAFPLFGMRIAVIIIILFCVMVLASAIRENKWKQFVLNGKKVLFLSSYYFLAIFSFLITLNIEKGLNDLETKASFAVFPVFFLLIKNKMNQKSLNTVLLVFSLSNLILAIYVWILIFNQGFFLMLDTDDYYHPVFRKIFSEISGAHLPYLGLWFGFSCIIFFKFILNKTIRNSIKWLLILSCFLLIASMFIFTARMALFSTILGMMFLGITSLKRSTLLKGVLFLVLIILGMTFLKPVKRRFNDLVSTEIKKPEKYEQSNEVNFRYVIYTCSYEILKEHWLFGLGLGNVQENLDQCYSHVDYINYDDFKVKNYNSHNQYLNAWLTYGILGLLFLIYYLVASFNGGLKVHKALIIMVALCLLTENILEREAGVVFFVFFNTILFYLKKEPTFNRYKISF
jgi:O-antigen ligase